METADLSLVRRAKAGDRDAFEELVRRHHPRIVRLAAALLSDPEEARDAAQDAFLKAYRFLEKFNEDASFGTWLYRIASNHCLDRLRARRPNQSWDELVEKEGERLEKILQGPGRQSDPLENRDLLARAMGALPPEYALVLTLRETEGLSYEEIARATDSSLDSVKARLKRARKELAERLRPLLKPDTF